MLPRLLYPFGEFSLMDMNAAIMALGALAGERRLALFRLLVQAGNDGLAAGTIAEKLSVPNSSLSFHLAQLRGAGLISQERQHRLLIYRANYPAMNALVDYLTENCCGGFGCAPASLSASPLRQPAAYRRLIQRFERHLLHPGAAFAIARAPQSVLLSR